MEVFLNYTYFGSEFVFGPEDLGLRTFLFEVIFCLIIWLLLRASISYVIAMMKKSFEKHDHNFRL